MALKYDELIKINLTGYEFTIGIKKYSLTGWSYENEYYIVIEDDEKFCKVKNKETEAITESHKTIIARRIDENPVMTYDKSINNYINKVHTKI